MIPPLSPRLSDGLLCIGVALVLSCLGAEAGLALCMLAAAMARRGVPEPRNDEPLPSDVAVRMVDAMPSPVLLCTDDGRVTAVSAPLRELRGAAKPGDAGPETLDGWISAEGLLDAAATGGGAVESVSGLLHRPGSRPVPVQLCLRQAPLGAGWLVGVAVVEGDAAPAVDVVETGEAGMPSLAPLLRESPLPLCITRRDDGRFVDLNEACARALNRPREAVLGRTAADIGLWASHEERTRILEGDGALPRVLRWAVVSSAHDGHPVRAWVCPFSHNGVDYLLGFAVDDEARVRAEQDLASERDFTQTILDTSGQGIVVADRQDRLLYANAAFADLVGVPAETLLGRPVRDFVDPDHVERYEGQLARRRSGERGLYETCMLHRSGARRSVLVTAIPHPVEKVGGSVALITDLTQIKDAHAQTEGQRAFYEDIVQRLPVRLVLIDADWRFRLVNRSAIPDDALRAQSIGRTLEEVGALSGMLEERLSNFRRARERLLQTGEPVEWTEDVVEVGPDGVRDRHVSLMQRLEALHNPDGTLIGYLGTAVDISDRVKAEQHAERQRRFYEAVVDAMPVQVTLLDEAFRMLYLNPAVVPDPERRAACLGRTYDEVCDLFGYSAATRARYLAARADVVQTGQAVEWVDGLGGARDTRHMLRRMQPLPSDQRFGPVAYIGLGVDLTERVEGEQQREAQRRFYEGVLDRLPLEVIVFDPDGRFLYVAPGAMPPEAREVALGRRYREIPGLDPHRASICEAWIDRTVSTGTTQTCEERRPDIGGGAEREVVHVSVPIRGANGEVEVIAAYTLDVTERKRQEASLRAAKVEAEQLSRAKSSFLANMSHEVRTPLAGIIGFAEVLADELSGPQHEAATLIRQSGLRLLDTLNSVLDLARLEADALTLLVSPVDLGAEAVAASRLFQGLTASRGVALVVEVPPAPLVVLADAAALHRVLVNLLSNATKFTTAGEVGVTVGDEAGAGPFVCIRDTGEGIDATFLPHLFEEFRQESSGLTRSHQGSGLGLSITRRLIDLMRGRIEVESVKGQGTTFTVYLPRA